MVKELWRQMLAWVSLLLSNVYIFLMKPECPQILMSWGITFPFLKCASFSLCLTLCNIMDCGQPGSFVHGNFPGKNTLVGCHFIFQGIFLTQGLNLHLLCLLHWQVILYHLSHQGSSQHIRALITLLTVVQFSSVAQSCLILFEHMDGSMPSLCVHHQLPEHTQTHVH